MPPCWWFVTSPPRANEREDSYGRRSTATANWACRTGRTKPASWSEPYKRPQCEPRTGSPRAYAAARASARRSRAATVERWPDAGAKEPVVRALVPVPGRTYRTATVDPDLRHTAASYPL